MVKVGKKCCNDRASTNCLIACFLVCEEVLPHVVLLFFFFFSCFCVATCCVWCFNDVCCVCVCHHCLFILLWCSLFLKVLLSSLSFHFCCSVLFSFSSPFVVLVTCSVWCFNNVSCVCVCCIIFVIVLLHHNNCNTNTSKFSCCHFLLLLLWCSFFFFFSSFGVATCSVWCFNDVCSVCCIIFVCT